MKSTKHIAIFLAATLLICLHTEAQVKPNGSGVPSVSNVPALPQANLGGKINYVRTWDAWKPITDPAQMTQQSIADVKVNTAYVDGQARVLQTVSKQISPAGKDMVSYKQFDKYGRETIQSLPYISTAANGDFKPNPFAEQQYYYSTGAVNNNQYTGEQIYFGRTALETSPLGRPDTVMAPGNNWTGSKRGVRYLYQVNTTDDSVRLWTIADAAGSTPATAAMYGAAELYKTITIDEHGSEVVEYKDKQGVVILKKVQLDASPGTAHVGWLCTYYIYDDYGLLRCVIQPQGIAELLWAGNWILSGTLLDELCFRYEYDQRNRMIIKKVPGAGEVHLVYDARDRLVMTQDANLRNQGKWLYTVYDYVNRVTASGTLNSSATRATHQSSAYSSTAYPNLSSYTHQELSSAKFDKYYASFPVFSTQDVSKLIAGDNPWPEAVAAATELVYGKATESQALGLGMGVMEIKTIFYDEKGRVVQTYTQHGELIRDITTNRYDFSGKLICSYQRHEYDNAVSNGQVNIRTRMLYDAAGRMIKTWKQMNDATETLTVQNSYDELGQLKQKKLAPEYNSNAGIETLDYEYNIRGWMKGINKDYTNGTSNTRWFGQTLSYDHGFTEQQYNGNISGMQWRSKHDGEQRAYGFTYDKVNRLSVADFTQYTSSAWNTSAGIDFTTNNLSYDANGNILSMDQKGWKLGGSSMIDRLAYSYEPGSNKLKQVLDNSNDFTSYLGDFKYDAALKTATDYTYDANGNLIKDINKGIKDNSYDGIEYNHLNLPSKIRVKDKGIIEYGYDANGNKQLKKTTDNTVTPARITTILYYDGFVYQNDTLQFIGHEEGRIRPLPPGGPGWAFDYFVKDHLGNVRVTLTDEQQADMYPAATMEEANAGIEESFYSNLPQTRVDVPGNYPANTPEGNEKVAKLQGNDGGSSNVMIGPAMALKVMAGDKFSFVVNSWWEAISKPAPPVNPFGELLHNISAGIGGITGGHPSSGDLQNSTELSGAVSNFLNSQTSNGNAHAYVNWLLFDEHFNLVSSGSGFEQVDQPNIYSTHSRTDMPIEKSGYLYICVSNASPNYEVFFDNLQVTHVRGPLLEAQSFYSFGLAQQGISSKALGFGEPKNNEQTFQGQRFDDDLGLNWIQFKWRNHDPQIGRFIEIDPLSEKYDYNSTYAFSENKVTSHVELEGLEAAWADFNVERDLRDVQTGRATIADIEKRFQGRAAASAIFTTKIAPALVVAALAIAQPHLAPSLILGYVTGAPMVPSPQAMSSTLISRTETVLANTADDLVVAEQRATQAITLVQEVKPVSGHPTFQPGPFAKESIPLASKARNFTAGQRNAINEIGKTNGCHTCGTKDAGTKTGNFVVDHQPVGALAPEGSSFVGLPQCLGCSQAQGGAAAAVMQGVKKAIEIVTKKN